MKANSDGWSTLKSDMWCFIGFWDPCADRQSSLHPSPTVCCLVALYKLFKIQKVIILWSSPITELPFKQCTFPLVDRGEYSFFVGESSFVVGESLFFVPSPNFLRYRILWSSPNTISYEAPLVPFRPLYYTLRLVPCGQSSHCNFLLASSSMIPRFLTSPLFPSWDNNHLINFAISHLCWQILAVYLRPSCLCRRRIANFFVQEALSTNPQLKGEGSPRRFVQEEARPRS